MLEYVSIHRYIHVLVTRHIRHIMYTILTPTTVQIRKNTHVLRPRAPRHLRHLPHRPFRLRARHLLRSSRIPVLQPLKVLLRQNLRIQIAGRVNRCRRRRRGPTRSRKALLVLGRRRGRVRAGAEIRRDGLGPAGFEILRRVVAAALCFWGEFLLGARTLGLPAAFEKVKQVTEQRASG